MQDLKYGSKEWLKQVDKIFEKYPKKVAFFFNKEHRAIATQIVKSKAKVDNVRYQDLKPDPLSMLSPKQNALITVKEVHSAAEYLQLTNEVQENWTDVLKYKFGEEIEEVKTED